MTLRLSKIVSLIESEIGIIDVGTDHGYIPVFLAENGYNGAIIASDINEGPIKTARNNASARGVTSKIEFSVADGLSSCSPERIDCIVIAGMGGDMICKILDAADWTMNNRYQIIMQPMTKQEILRYWLVNNGYCINGEYFVQENDRIFTIITARFSGANSKLSMGEYFVGQKSLIETSDLFAAIIDKECAKCKRVLDAISKSNRTYGAEYRFYSELLSSLNEMRTI